MKRCLFMILLMVMFAGCAMAAAPGEEVAVEVTVSSSDAVFTILEYSYDPQALEYAAADIDQGVYSGASDGRLALARMNGLNGRVGTLCFRVKASAAPGTYPISVKATQVFNKEEKETKLSASVASVEVEEDRIRAFVRRCYKLILNRDADEGGLAGWSKALADRTAAAAQIIDGFVKSDEFTNRSLTDSDKVDILYRTMLNREADAGGKAGWVDALSKGYTLQNIIDGFCGSEEFKKICDSFGIEPGSVNAAPPADTTTPRGKIEAFVRRCYSLILSREADQGGLTGWSEALESKTAPAARIIEGFVASEEYTNRNLTPDQSVDILYKTMLGREADAAGKAGWVDALSKGYTFQHIINGFCGSAEFTAICNEYGIEAGSVAIPQGAAVPAQAEDRIGTAVSADETGRVTVIGYERDKVEDFVRYVYREALGREADEAGLAAWSEKILAGDVSPKAFLRGLLFSDEMAERKLNNEQYIEMLYRLYLKRNADAAAAEWVNVLASAGHDAVIRGFEGSDEFRGTLAGFGL